MADTEFTSERLLEQASGNQSAIFLLGVKWAREHDGSVDAWAEFVGREFAEGWDDMRDGSVLEVARQVGLNFACGADSKLAALNGDESQAEAVIDGPDPKWLTDAGVSVEDNDRANDIIFRTIAERIGLSFESRRDSDGLHLAFSRG